MIGNYILAPSYIDFSSVTKSIDVETTKNLVSIIDELVVEVNGYTDVNTQDKSFLLNFLDEVKDNILQFINNNLRIEDYLLEAYNQANQATEYDLDIPTLRNKLRNLRDEIKLLIYEFEETAIGKAKDNIFHKEKNVLVICDSWKKITINKYADNIQGYCPIGKGVPIIKTDSINSYANVLSHREQLNLNKNELEKVNILLEEIVLIVPQIEKCAYKVVANYNVNTLNYKIIDDTVEANITVEELEQSEINVYKPMFDTYGLIQYATNDKINFSQPPQNPSSIN